MTPQWRGVIGMNNDPTWRAGLLDLELVKIEPLRAHTKTQMWSKLQN